MASSALPSKMRSAQWTTIPIQSSLTLNASTPLPSDAHSLPNKSALIKVSYASLNPVDYKATESSMFRLFGMGGKAPWMPCCDFSGTVITTNNLPHIRPGDRVVGFTSIPKFGTLAEYVVVEGSENIAKLPDGVDMKHAATLTVAGQTALQCIAPFVQKGDHVVINGASGGTGHFGIQIATMLGCTVTAVCSGVNAEFCKRLGAAHVIDYTSGDVAQQLRNSGFQYDLIIDNIAIGGPIYSMAHHYLKPAGKYVTIAAGPDLATVVGLIRTLGLPAWLGGGKRKSALIGHRADREELEKMAGWVRDGKVVPEIERVYDLSEAADAFARLKTGRTRGKIVIKVEDE
ncbi:hypothetical protein VTL71DRAFT_15640 [Oculimacula yallundae]|uniref:Enoyl reductase (ER) domain-containing protein n=1 Tax=Oculimacula yallundae TaxID=86028 RepID=A0ABR4CIJ6_9HELO